MRYIINCLNWLFEDFFLKKLIKGFIIPFLEHPVKRVLACGGVILILILAVRGEITADDVTRFFSNTDLLWFIGVLLIAEIPDLVIYSIFPAKTKKRKTKKRVAK